MTKEETARRVAIRNDLSPAAKRLRQQFARLQLQRLDAQLRRGRITDLPGTREDDARHG